MGESGHVKHFRKRHLEGDESIVASARGYIGKMFGTGEGPMGKLVGSGGDAQTNGALIITSRRVVFYRKGLLGEVLETMPIDKLTSVEQLTLMMKRTLRIHTSGDNLEFKSLNKEEYQAVVEALEEGRKAAGSGGAVESPQDSPVDASPQDSPVDILTKLAALRDSGVLSQEEFDEKKKSILEDI